MKKVIVRPGDKVTHLKFEGHVFTVLSVREYTDKRGMAPCWGEAILAIDDTTGKCRRWRPNFRTSFNGEIVTDYVDHVDDPTVDEATAVTARPGDTITWHGEARVVLSRQQYEDIKEFSNLPDGAVAWKDSLGRPTWNRINHTELRLNGKVVTHFEDATALVSPSELVGVNLSPFIEPLAKGAVADRMCSLHDKPATPRLGTQEPDEDGMVIGWDGRKVWL